MAASVSIEPGIPGSARPVWVDGYLARLGVGDPGEPSLPALRALHRAHVEKVPYEVLDIQLERPTSVDPQESVARVLRGRGGYCVQLNTAFAALLGALGYRVTQHRAGIQGRGAARPSDAEFAPHLALTVELQDRTWLVDVGLGDGLHEPVPLGEGDHRHGPMSFRLEPSRVEAGGWRFQHDPRGSIAGMDVRMAPAGNAEFAEWHHYLATSPESRLVRAAVVMRRDGDGADFLMGCMLRRIDGAGRKVRELTGRQEWFDCLSEIFDLRLTDIGERQRTALWDKVRAAHDAWLAQRAKSA